MKTLKDIIFVEKSGTSDANKQVLVISNDEPDKQHLLDGSLWINTSFHPPRVFRFNKETDHWDSVNILDTNLVLGSDPPEDPYEGLLWLDLSTYQLSIYHEDSWKPITTTSSSSSSTTVKTYYGDNKTIQIAQDTGIVSVIFHNEEAQEAGYLWDNKRIQKEALVKALIFG
jgi:hypothetical protein